MFKNKKTILAALLFIASLKAFCGVVDHDIMYQAYLDNDMSVWKTELQKYTTSNELTNTDKLEIRDGPQALLQPFGYVNSIQIPFWFWHDVQPRLILFVSALRGSDGFFASSGIAHERPKRSAPGMRPCEIYWLTRRSDIPHL